MSNASIQCHTVYATVSIKPSLINGGTATSTAIGIKGTIAGCTVTGATATILTSSFSGKLTGTSNDCAALLGTNPVVGTLTIKWKSDKTTPLLQTSSVVTPGSLTGGTFAGPGGPTESHGEFTLGAPGNSVSGAFTGGDNGAGSNTVAATSEDLGAILGGCATTAGVKTLHIGMGTLTLS